MINNIENIEDITFDFFYKKKVIAIQRKRGYRFSVDSPILADFLPFSPNDNALEIGTGSGIISLLALYKKKFSFIYGIEIQDKLSRLAKINIKKNNLNKKFKVINADFNEIYKNFSGIKTIFSNPPFKTTSIGRLSPNEEIRISKTEIKITLKELLKKSFSILGEKGSLYLILPYNRYKELIGLSNNIGYSISKLRYILSFKDGKVERFLIQLTNDRGSFKKLKPLIVFKHKGVYTNEMEDILSGN